MEHLFTCRYPLVFHLSCFRGLGGSERGNISEIKDLINLEMPQLNAALNPHTASTQVRGSSAGCVYCNAFFFLYSPVHMFVSVLNRHGVNYVLPDMLLLKFLSLHRRDGHALLALTLTNQHDRAARSAVQTAQRATSSRGVTNLMH